MSAPTRIEAELQAITIKPEQLGNWYDGPETFVIVKARDVKLGSQHYHLAKPTGAVAVAVFWQWRSAHPGEPPSGWIECSQEYFQLLKRQGSPYETRELFDHRLVPVPAGGALSEQDAQLLNQAVDLLADYAAWQSSNGNCSAHQAAMASAHAVLRLAVVALAAQKGQRS